MPSKLETPPINILIAGQPGSGGSTLRDNILALPNLELEKVSGGRIRRAYAQHWQEFSQGQNQDDAASNWRTFSDQYHLAYEQRGYQGVVELFDEHLDLPPDTESLNAFNVAQAQYGASENLWDLIIDASLYHKLLTSDHSVLIESKLATILDLIDELHRMAIENPVLSQPLIKILLVVEPEIAAQRISRREGRTITVDEVQVRNEADWERYGRFYHIDGKPLTFDDLVAASHVIDTSYLTPEEVLAEVLRIIQLAAEKN